MSDTQTKLIEAVTAMNPITRSWLIHGNIVAELLSVLSIEELSEHQREHLADGCHTWGELLTEAGLLWWDAEERLRREMAA